MDSLGLKVYFYKGNSIIKKIGFNKGQTIAVTIGRDGENVDVGISSPLLSKQHGQLIFTEVGELYYVDLASSNGSFINKTKLRAHDQNKLKTGDRIHLVESGEVYFEILDSADKPSSGNNSNTGVPLSQTEIINKFNDKNKIVIGRNADCDVVLNSPSISRKHCEIEKLTDGSFKLIDLNSLNGVFVNGSKVKGSVKIGVSDNILIDKFAISLKGKMRDLSEESAIRTEAIVKKYPNGYIGLNKTTLSVPSKSLLAIMGPSGCGKSTLLKALNGESPASQGRVYLFEQELIANYEYLKTQIGYVPQDDIVHRELTVRQSLYFAAKLRLDNPTDEFIENKIAQVLSDLNIAFIKDNLVSKISGGQRKRVSIAVELLTDPLILFLDEPTSPLDPQTIEEFLGILRRLAEKGTTVIMVTHKPEDLGYMDQVIFMAEGGHIVYFGDTDNYQNYFGVKTPVKVYMNITGETSKKWIQKFDSGNNFENTNTSTNQDIRKRDNTNSFRQFWWLTMRYFRIKTNDRSNTAVLIAQAPLIAGLICLIFEDISLAVPFLMAISAVWFGVNNAAREVVSELPIYMRERMFNVQLIPYVFSKLTVLTVFSAIQSFLFISIIYLNFSNSEIVWDSPFDSFVWMLLLSLSATLMGLFLSTIVSTTEKVMTIVPLALIPQIMLGGVVAKISSSLVEVISYVTLSRWGTEGFSILQKDVVGTSVEIKDESLVQVETEKDANDMPVLDSEGNPVVSEVDLGDDNFVSLDTQQDAVESLHEQFHANYFDFFGDLAGTMRLDVIAVVILSFLLFGGIIWALKKKDSIPRTDK